jgi:hypothetical protein
MLGGFPARLLLDTVEEDFTRLLLRQLGNAFDFVDLLQLELL